MKYLSKASFLIIIAALIFTGCKKSDHHDHVDAAGFRILMNNEVVAEQTGTVVTGTISIAGAAVSDELTVEFRDPEGHVLTITDDDFSLQVTSSNTSVASVQASSGARWSFRLNGVSVGQAELTISLMHGNHPDFESRPVSVIVIATEAS